MTDSFDPRWDERRAASNAAALGGFVMPREIRTERLTLRPFAMHDVGAFARFWGDAETTRFIGGPRDLVMTFETMARFTGAWWLYGFGVYALEDRNGDLVGYAGLWFPADKPEIEIAYGMLPEARGQGLCAEAVRAIRAEAERNGAPSLVSYIDPQNEGSRRVARAVGAAVDGAIAFGPVMADVWRYPVDPAAADPLDEEDREILLETSAMPLSIRTRRLLLTQWRPDHLEPFAAQVADADAMRFIGGPRMDIGQASRLFLSYPGHWLLRGYGMYAVEHEGSLVGSFGLYNPAGWPELEVSYHLDRAVWGRGFATEAAAAVRDIAAEQGRSRLVSFIDPANDRSIAVARRLGAVTDGEVTLFGTPVTVWRHAIPRSAEASAHAA